MTKNFYITTAIDYPNGSPHMGHALEKIASDAYARWYKFLGYNSYFMTGTDENGQKLIESAKALGQDTQAFVDENSLKFKKLCKDLNISNNVNFNMFTRTIQDKYFQSSLFLMTSRSEAFGMVLIEAMASGLPCLAYDCPIGPRAIINEGENGFLIEDGNVDSFVQKLELLIDNENLRIKMGKNAITSIKKYNIDSIMQQWKMLFESLVKQ